MVEVSSGKPKTVEPQIWSEQQTCWALLVGHARVATLPPPAFSEEPLSELQNKNTEYIIDENTHRFLLHHVYGFRVLCEAESVAAGGRPEVYSYDNGEWTSHPGPDLHLLRERRETER